MTPAELRALLAKATPVYTWAVAIPRDLHNALPALIDVVEEVKAWRKHRPAIISNDEHFWKQQREQDDRLRRIDAALAKLEGK